MDWPSSIVGFGLGLLSSLVIVKVNDRLRARRAASDNFLSPMYEQLGEIHGAIERYMEAFRVPAWREAVSRGLSGRIAGPIRKDMEHLHKVTFPAYNSAQHEADKALWHLCERWHSQYGVPVPHGISSRAYKQAPDFFVAEKFEGVPDLGADYFLNVDNKLYITAEKLRELHLTPNQFLERLWDEAQNDPAIIRFREVRRQALSEVEKLRQRLAARIQI